MATFWITPLADSVTTSDAIELQEIWNHLNLKNTNKAWLFSSVCLHPNLLAELRGTVKHGE
jgi:hypothetical protein